MPPLEGASLESQPNRHHSYCLLDRSRSVTYGYDMIRHATTGSPDVVYILSFVPLIQGGTRKHTVYDGQHTTYSLHAFLIPLTFSPVAKTRSRCAAAGTAANLFGSSGVVFFFCARRSLHRRTRLRILIELRRTDRPNTCSQQRYVRCATPCHAQQSVSQGCRWLAHSFPRLCCSHCCRRRDRMLLEVCVHKPQQ